MDVGQICEIYFRGYFKSGQPQKLSSSKNLVPCSMFKHTYICMYIHMSIATYTITVRMVIILYCIAMNTHVCTVRSVHSELEKAREEISDLKLSCEDLQEDLGSSKEKEDQLLSFTEKLTSSNAELQSEKTILEQKVSRSSGNIRRSVRWGGSRSVHWGGSRGV